MTPIAYGRLGLTSCQLVLVKKTSNSTRINSGGSWLRQLIDHEGALFGRPTNLEGSKQVSEDLYWRTFRISRDFSIIGRLKNTLACQCESGDMVKRTT
jgi:hypothetical protein